ncbi:MAG: holo-ACP synthase [Chloroflexota bacterium]
MIEIEQPISVGVDMVEILRVERLMARYGSRFLNRVFTEIEQAECNNTPERYAVRFAAKEATSKVLGTGIGIVSWRDIEVKHLASGKPYLNLYGAADRRAKQLGLVNWAVSLSHSQSNALAFVVATKAS